MKSTAKRLKIQTGWNDAQCLIWATWLVISDKANWTRGTFARTSTGHVTNPHSADACKWCQAGARDLVVGNGDQVVPVTQSLARIAVLAAANELHGSFPIWVNDHYGYAAVKKMYARAMELAA